MKNSCRLSGWFVAACASFGLATAAPLHAQEPPPQPGTEPQASAPTPTLEEVAPPQIPTSRFAGSSRFWDAKLSPDGRMLSFVRERSGDTEFVIAEVDTQKVVRAFAVGEDDQIEWYRWVTSNKMLISVSTMGEFFDDEVRFTRLLLTEINEGTLEYLFGRTSVVEGDNVIHVAEDGSHILVSIQKSIYDYPSVMRHELKPDGDVETVQKPKDGVWNWVADDNGVVRMGTGWSGNRLRIFYRSEGDNGRVGLRLFNFATREEVETLYENPDWDVDTVAMRDGKPFAAFYTADRDEVHWFDEDTKKQYAALRKALGDLEIWVVSRSKDHSRMLVWAGSESDPGVLYLYEPAAKLMREIAQYRPGLDFRQLARPKPVNLSARDGTRISAYLTLPRGREASGLPLIILPHGGPYGVRDKLQYNDEVQLLTNRGYAVLQPNYRGSGGYGEAFFELGKGQIGRGMQDDIDDAMDWAVAEGIADPNRVCVVGGSYGGYAAIWAVLRNPERYRCAASWAGVTDWDRMLRYDRQFFGRRGYKRWRERIRGEGEKDMKDVSPYRIAEQLSRPLLLAHGTKDVVVPYKQFKQFEKAARKAQVKPTTLVIEDEGHSFTSPDNEQQWYDALVDFLAEHNPPDLRQRAQVPESEGISSEATASP